MEDIIEVLGQAVDLLNPIEDNKISNDIQIVLTQLSNCYVPVLWPESQELMELDWFSECILDVDYKVSEASSSTYLVPINRYLQFVSSL